MPSFFQKSQPPQIAPASGFPAVSFAGLPMLMRYRINVPNLNPISHLAADPKSDIGTAPKCALFERLVKPSAKQLTIRPTNFFNDPPLLTSEEPVKTEIFVKGSCIMQA